MRLFQKCYDGLNSSPNIQPDSRLLYMGENPGKLSTSVTLLRPSESIIGLLFVVLLLLLIFPYSPASSVKVKNVWSHTSTPSECFHSVYRDSCTFAALKLQPHADFFIHILRYFNNDSATTFSVHTIYWHANSRSVDQKLPTLHANRKLRIEGTITCFRPYALSSGTYNGWISEVKGTHGKNRKQFHRKRTDTRLIGNNELHVEEFFLWS